MPRRQNVVKVKLVGAEVEIRQDGVDPSEFSAAIGDVKQRTADLKPVWQGFEPIWYQQNLEIFTSEGVPPWPRLSPAYQRAKAAAVGPLPILVYTGRLRASLVNRTQDTVYVATARTLRMGTRVPYSKYLDARRPHVLLLDDTVAELTDLITDYLSVPLNP